LSVVIGIFIGLSEAPQYFGTDTTSGFGDLLAGVLLMCPLMISRLSHASIQMPFVPRSFSDAPSVHQTPDFEKPDFAPALPEEAETTPTRREQAETGNDFSVPSACSCSIRPATAGRPIFSVFGVGRSMLDACSRSIGVRCSFAPPLRPPCSPVQSVRIRVNPWLKPFEFFALHSVRIVENREDFGARIVPNPQSRPGGTS
jgi:hypothetical protein